MSAPILRRLQAIGSELVLMPGAMVARWHDGEILFAQRGDDDTWYLPAGAAEPGGSFARLAVVRGCCWTC